MVYLEGKGKRLVSKLSNIEDEQSGEGANRMANTTNTTLGVQPPEPFDFPNRKSEFFY